MEDVAIQMPRGRCLARKRMRLASTGGLAGPPTSFGSDPTTPQDLCPKRRATTSRELAQSIPAVSLTLLVRLCWSGKADNCDANPKLWLRRLRCSRTVFVLPTWCVTRNIARSTEEVPTHRARDDIQLLRFFDFDTDGPASLQGAMEL